MNARVVEKKLWMTLLNDGPVHIGANGRRETPLTGRGLGLANARERLQVLYGDQHEFRLEYRARGGVEVSLTIPFERLPSPVPA